MMSQQQPNDDCGCEVESLIRHWLRWCGGLGHEKSMCRLINLALFKGHAWMLLIMPRVPAAEHRHVLMITAGRKHVRRSSSIHTGRVGNTAVSEWSLPMWTEAEKLACKTSLPPATTWWTCEPCRSDVDSRNNNGCSM